VKKILWEDSIIHDNFYDEDTSIRIKDILNICKANNNFANKSNVNGFQTKNLDDKIIAKQILEWSAILIKKEYKVKSNIKLDLELNNFWINENYKYSYNKSHTHPGANLSGVYYLDVPENSGNIFFEDFTKQFTNLHSCFEGEEFQNYMSLKNNTNQLVIFPSNITHGVEASMTDKPRISLSFNLVLHYQTKSV